MFQIDVLRPITSMSTVIKPQITANITPQKPNISILKSSANQSSLILSTSNAQQLTPSKTVKFKLLLDEEPDEPVKRDEPVTKQQVEFSEPFEIVNLKDKIFELRKSSSVASIDSAMSTISSRSAFNLGARLADLENDEKLMNAEGPSSSEPIDDTYLKILESYNPQTFSNDSSSNDSNVLNEENETKTTETNSVFKQPIETAKQNETKMPNSFFKIISTESFANSTISSKSGTNLAERLNDFESHTIEENFRPLCNKDSVINEDNLLIAAETKCIFKQPIEIIKQNETKLPSSFYKISSTDSFANSTISSKSGLAERLNDFESHTIEENFRPIDFERKEEEEQQQEKPNDFILPVANSFSVNSIQSTLSSQSAKNLQERLEDFENESMSDFKMSGNDKS